MHLHGLLSVARLSGRLHVRLEAQQGGDAVAKQRVIVHS